MTWRNVATQWATVLVLLALVVAVHFYKPEWTGIDIGKSQQRGTDAGEGAYHAIDGDSFRIGNVEIRLHGIDAPEYRQSCRTDRQQDVACGKLARDQLSRLISGAPVTCQIVDRDRYGRQVSICKNGKLDINREMVRLGWAVAYRRHAVSYIAAEREARLAKRGIWAWRFEVPEDYRAKHRAVQGGVSGSSFKDD